MFFICIGIVNALVWILEQMTYFIRNTAGYGYWLVNVFRTGQPLDTPNRIYCTVHYLLQKNKNCE